MPDLANDSTVPRRSGLGVLYGLSSSAAFGLSGPLAKGLIDAGWTAGSAVTARLLLAAAVMLVAAALSLRSVASGAAQSQGDRRLRNGRGRRMPARVLQRGRLPAGGRRIADRIHCTGGRDRLVVVVVAARTAARSAHPDRSRHRGRGGFSSSGSVRSPPRRPTCSASPPVADWGRGWLHSSAWPRWCRQCCSLGYSSARLPRPFSSPAER
ncbi:MAG: hypothetical protein QOJ80_84 [Mycobacterium sp.]|nr:hypothetical protein [Mycobacterium sp.]